MIAGPTESAYSLPYVEMTHDTYAQLASQQFTIEEPQPGTRVLRGPCPRCGTIIEVTLPAIIFRSTRGILARLTRKRLSDGPSHHVEPLICNCDDFHEGRPSGRVGCGAFWTLTISAEAQ